MSFKEWTQHLFGRNGQTQEGPEERPTGGTSCYRPAQEPKRRKDHGEMAPIRVLHTGFTGIMPRQTEYYDPNQAYNPYAAEQSGYYADPTGWPQGQNTQYTGQNGYRQNVGYEQDPWTKGYQPTPVQPGWDPYRTQEVPPDVMFAAQQPAGTVRLLTLTSLHGCYDVIDGMRNGQILLVMMDTIANDAEILRCQDMLMGASFTLGCTVRVLQAGRMMLIAPAGVQVLPEERDYRTAEFGPEAYRSDLA